MNKPSHISILGGGPAGMASAFYAQKAGVAFDLYEASLKVGGNAQTIQHKKFLFDSGAHRFHDKYPDITNDIKMLMGDELQQIYAPSQIYSNGKFFNFPLTPLNLIKKLGFKTFIAGSTDMLKAKLKIKRGEQSDFESAMVNAYGRTIAQKFLLNYSEKLWGIPTNQLSIDISGNRLKGLNLKSFFLDSFYSKQQKARHVDGSFFYPLNGIGSIFDKIQDSCNSAIHTGSIVSKIFHSNNRIDAIEINNKQKIKVDTVINSLPVNLFLNSLHPLPNNNLLNIISSIKFRHVILVVLFIKKKRLTQNATIYFPDKEFPFTRISEPINRSISMAPEGYTSLVAEIPCFSRDPIWTANQDKIIDHVTTKLVETKLIKADEVIESLIHKLQFAYPVVETGMEQKLESVYDYLSSFDNLHILGRNAEFKYLHIHNLFKESRELAHKLKD